MVALQGVTKIWVFQLWVFQLWVFHLVSAPCGSDLLGVSALGFAALAVAALWCVFQAMKKRHCAIADIETRSISVREKGEILDFLRMWLKALSHVPAFYE